jgi:hypothetical protein
VKNEEKQTYRAVTSFDLLALWRTTLFDYSDVLRVPIGERKRQFTPM